MLNFILSGPQSEKDNYIAQCIAKDLNDNKKVLLIVPEQEAVLAEKRITAAVSSSDAVFALEIANFRRLSDIVRRNVGSLCYNYISKGGQAIIMWRVLSELAPTLNTYRIGDSTDIGLISSLIALFKEMKQYCILPEVLQDATLELNDNLKLKTEDISMIYDLYCQYIDAEYDNADDDILMTADLLSGSGLFSDANVYIDSFNGFTPAELAVIGYFLANAPEVKISLCVDLERDTEMFTSILRIKDRITGIAEKCGCEVAQDVNLAPAYVNPCAGYIAKNLWATIKEDKACENDYLRLLACKNKYTECEFVARDIMRRVAQGARYRDFTVIFGSQEHFSDIIDPIFARHNIPCHFSARKDITQHPMSKVVLAALAIISKGWRRDDVIAYLHTGYSTLNDEECDALEEYSYVWSIEGSRWYESADWTMNPDGFTSRTTKYTHDTLKLINSARRSFIKPICVLKEAIGKGVTGKALARCLYDFMSYVIDTDKLTSDDVPVWNCLCEALEQLSLCCDDKILINAENAKRLLRLMISQLNYGNIPATLECVNVGTVQSLRSVRTDYVYLIGVNDGVFPTLSQNVGVFSDDERTELDCAGIRLSGDSEEMYYEQMWYFYRALLAANKHITVTFASKGLMGEELLPSSGVGEILAMFGNEILECEEEISPLELIWDKESARRYLDSDDNSIRREVEKFLGVDTTASGELSTVECSLDEATAKQMFAGDLSMSQTRFDGFVRCRFAYHMNNVLKLRERRKAELDYRNIGTFVHNVLENYFYYMRNVKGDFTPLTEEESDKLLDRIISDYLISVFNRTGGTSKRMLALFKRLKRQSKVFIENINRELSNSDFVPSLFELNISDGEGDSIKAYRIPLDDGYETYVYGQIDRVDTYEKDGKVYFRIVDYKTGKHDFDRRNISKGLELQLLLYMLSILHDPQNFNRLLGSSGEAVPVGLCYYLASLSGKSVGSHRMSADEVFEKVVGSVERKGTYRQTEDIPDLLDKSAGKIYLPKVKRNGEATLLETEELGALISEIEDTVRRISASIKKGEADAVPNNGDTSICDNCKMRVICRNMSNAEEEDDE